MKTIFHKLFATEKEGKPINATPAWPLPACTESIHESQKRALIGWIANRMGQKLRMDQSQSELLLYLSFNTKESTLNQANDEPHYLISLASCLVEWVGQQDDVYDKIKELLLQDKYHRSLLETYEEIKQDIGLYIPHLHQSKDDHHSEQDEVWQVYRDVIYAVTQRKFLLIRKNEVDKYKEGKLLCTSSIQERSDIPKARELAKQSLLAIGIPQTVVMSHLLVISEAITNILKHAREGKMSIVESESCIHVLVEDKGPGFPLKLLPNTTLLAGYSTKKSLGQGFTLMMKMTQLVLLSTTPGEGSTLILSFNREGSEHSNEKHHAG